MGSLLRDNREKGGGGYAPFFSVSVSPTLFNISWRYLQRRPWQSVLMIVGITLGVAVAVAVDLANASARQAFDLSTDAVAGRTTHQIFGGPLGIDETLYVDLRQEGLDIAIAPVVSAYVSSPQLGNQPLQLLGVDPFAELPFRNYLGETDTGIPIEGLIDFFTRPGAILISTNLAERFQLEPCEGSSVDLTHFTIPDGFQNVENTVSKSSQGCVLTLEIFGYAHLAFIAGLLESADSLSRRALDGLILADIATAQELTGQIGKLTSIDLIIPEGDTASIDQINALLPDSTRIQPAAARSDIVEDMTAAFRLNLSALSLLALVVGLFLIYNTMIFSVVQRRPLFGTLRCLGATRREIFILVVGEALIAGILGSVFGLLLGVFFSQGAVRMVTQTINDLFFVVTIRGVAVSISSLVKGAVLGVLTTVLAAAMPAWEAASVPPRAALSRSGLETKAKRAISVAATGGLVLSLFGAIILLLPDDGVFISFTGTFAILVGFALLTPLTTSILMRGISPVSTKVWRVLGRMAPRNVVNSLSRTSIAVAALMVAVSVTIGISLMVGSFRYSVIVWLTQTLQGDIYISPPTSILNPGVLTRLGSWPGIDQIDTLRLFFADSPDGPIRVTATSNVNTGVEQIFLTAVGPPEEIWGAMEAGAIIVSEPLANRLGLTTSSSTNQISGEGRSSIMLFTDNGLHTFPIVGVYYDYTSSQGHLLMSMSTYHSLWDDNAINALTLRLTPGSDPDQVTTELRDALKPIQQLSISPNSALREAALVVFDRTFAITSVLQILATIVAFIGILSALLSLQLEKQREMGILRAVGLTVGQMRGLVLLETGLMGTVAGLLSMPTGFVLSLILIYIINKRSFGWTLLMQVRPDPFFQALLVAVVAALLAGVYPAYKMGKMATADALRGE